MSKVDAGQDPEPCLKLNGVAFATFIGNRYR
jgi:hypothetical protein